MTLKVLAIETSMGETSVAVLASDAAGSARVSARHLQQERTQAETLIPLVSDVMAESGLTFRDLDRIAVCIGPGGFSSIRVGVAAARGIGLAAGKPVVGATSFRIMARDVLENRGHPHEHHGFGLAIPAGQGALFCQAFTCCGGEASEIVVLADDEAPEWFAKRVSSVAGPAALRVAQSAAKRGVSVAAGVEVLAPNAETLSKMAADLDPAADLPLPMYIRPADAKPQTAGIVPRKDKG